MKAPVEFVTLSDSLTSEDADAGTAKVLCLDSDTESDGSYAHAFVKEFSGRTADCDESGCSPDVYKHPNDSWIGLHKCSSYRTSWSPRHSLSFGKVTDVNRQASFNGIDQSGNGGSTLDSHLVVNRKPTVDSTPLIQSDNPHSLKIVPLSDLKCKLDVDNKAVQLSNCTTDMNLGTIVSPCASLEQGICFDNFDTYSNSMSFASPCHEVKSALMLCANTHDVDAPANHGACFSSPSQELNDYTLLAWDDHLKGISRKLESTIATATIAVKSETFWRSNSESSEQRTNAECDDPDDGDKDSGDHSFLKKLSCSTGKRDVGDISASGAGSIRKRHRSGEADSKPTERTQGGCKSRIRVCKTAVRDNADVTQVLDKDEEKLAKKEKQLKDREDRGAKKQQLKEERAILRQQKQEEKKRLQELKKQRNEEEKKRKEELKSEAVERRKVEKEREKWEKGKFALQNITALVDTQIVEQGLIGGHLLTRLAEKGFKYHLVKNPVKKTVIWQMKLPSKESVLELQEDCQSQDSLDLKSSTKLGPQFLLESKSVSYVLIVLEAEEFLEMITDRGLDKHVRNLQKLYPGSTICYLINKLMRHLHKREQQQYKNPGDTWTRPPVEQILAKLVTSYCGVHSRVCVDEAEVCEHIVGLTRSLAECPFKRKLTPLSLSANGDHLVKNDPNNEVIRKDVWLKALVAIPKVSGSCAPL